MAQPMVRMPPEVLADRAAEIVEDARIKFLAKRRKEDGRNTHLLVAITGGARRLLNRQKWVEEDDYRRTVECFEQFPLSQSILSQPAVVTLEDWRWHAKGGPLSRRGPERAGNQLDMEQDSQCTAAQQRLGLVGARGP